MEINIEEKAYASTKWYSGTVIIEEDVSEDPFMPESEIKGYEFTIAEQWDENGDSTVVEITFMEELLAEIDEEDLKNKIIDKFNEL